MEWEFGITSFTEFVHHVILKMILIISHTLCFKDRISQHHHAKNMEKTYSVVSDRAALEL